MFGSWRTDRKIAALYRILKTWRKQDMANWEMIKADIAALKAIAEREWRVVMDLKAKLADALAKEALDPADVQAVHDDLASFAVDLESKLHGDGG